MGLKSIEMQVALPRTQDAGKIQDQMQKQGEHLQGALVDARLKEEKIKRTRLQEMEKADKLKPKEESEAQKGETTKKESREQDELIEPSHPYLGKQIDFNG